MARLRREKTLPRAKTCAHWIPVTSTGMRELEVGLVQKSSRLLRRDIGARIAF